MPQTQRPAIHTNKLIALFYCSQHHKNLQRTATRMREERDQENVYCFCNSVALLSTGSLSDGTADVCRERRLAAGGAGGGGGMWRLRMLPKKSLSKASLYISHGL